MNRDGPADSGEKALPQCRTAPHQFSAIWLRCRQDARLRGVLYVLAALLLIAPAIACFMYIDWTGRNVPDIDTWGFIPTISHSLATRGLDWSALWAPDLQARPILWRICLLLVAWGFHFNVQLLKFVAVPFIGVELWACLLIVRQGRDRPSPLKTMFILAPVGLLLFGLGNWENLLREWNVANIGAVAFAMLAVVETSRAIDGRSRPVMRSIAGIGLCVVASLMGEPGLIAWPTCIVVSIWPWTPKRNVIRAVVLIAAIAFLAIYAEGLPGSSFLANVSDFPAFCVFGIVTIGNGVIGSFENQALIGVAFAIGVGECLLGLGAICLLSHSRFRSTKSHYRMSMGITLLGLLGALSLALGRSNTGIGESTVSRYALITAPMAIGLYLVFTQMASDVRRQSASGVRAKWEKTCAPVIYAITAITLLGVLGGALAGDASEVYMAQYRRDYWESMEYIACHASTASDQQLAIYQYANTDAALLQSIAELRESHLSVFSGNQCELVSKLGS
jgi:hypothetical protein